MITDTMTVARLLEEQPELVEFLASYHPHFQRLCDPLLRRVMAARVTLTDAARIAGLVPEVFLADVRRAAGDAGTEACAVTSDAPPWTPTPMPEALQALRDRQRVLLDVRADLARGDEPFARIMAAITALAPDAALLLRVPFEPMPLYDVLGRRGFAHWTERRAPDDWTVWFWRDARAAEAATPAPAATAAGPAVTLDVRGLEPPEPMVLVLERAESLARGETLEVTHDRRPQFLYPVLEERGFAHETDEPEAGVVRIRIRRGAKPG